LVTQLNAHYKSPPDSIFEEGEFARSQLLLLR
jgi:hypothetical protein